MRTLKNLLILGLGICLIVAIWAPAFFPAASAGSGLALAADAEEGGEETEEVEETFWEWVNNNSEVFIPLFFGLAVIFFVFWLIAAGSRRRAERRERDRLYDRDEKRRDKR